jgi:hypothetical protein
VSADLVYHLEENEISLNFVFTAHKNAKCARLASILWIVTPDTRDAARVKRAQTGRGARKMHKPVLEMRLRFAIIGNRASRQIKLDRFF